MPELYPVIRYSTLGVVSLALIYSAFTIFVVFTSKPVLWESFGFAFFLVIISLLGLFGSFKQLRIPLLVFFLVNLIVVILSMLMATDRVKLLPDFFLRAASSTLALVQAELIKRGYGNSA